MTDWSKFTTDKRGILHGYRSGLEGALAKQLKAAGQPVRFEDMKIEYIKPSKPSKYTPDFVLANGIIIESKGQFKTEDKQKHLLIQKQHPELDIRFVFSNSSAYFAPQKDADFRKWLKTEKGITVVGAAVKDKWKPVWLDHLRSKKLKVPSQTTYAMWCEKYGFKYADKIIPIAWIKE